MKQILSVALAAFGILACNQRSWGGAPMGDYKGQYTVNEKGVRGILGITDGGDFNLQLTKGDTRYSVVGSLSRRRDLNENVFMFAGIVTSYFPTWTNSESESFAATFGTDYTDDNLETVSLSNPIEITLTRRAKTLKDSPSQREADTSEQKETLTPGAKAILKAMYETAPNATYDQIDCTRFMARTLSNAGFRLDSATLTRIFMSDVDPNQMLRLVVANDPRISGVVGALVNSGQATVVKTGPPQPGDVIQYFYWEGGHYKGHAGIVEKVYGDGDRVDLYGSHGSRGGVGTLPKLNLRGKTHYLARPN